MQLAPGLRTVLSEFETAARNDEMRGAGDPDEMDAVHEYFDGRKQAMLRKLLRMQNGEELVDVEALKKQMRRMSRFIHNMQMILDRQAPIASIMEDMRQNFKASPEVLADAEKIIGTRRKW